jgi:hypothetical protein
LVDLAFIKVIFTLQSLLDFAFLLCLDNLVFAEQHLFLDADDGFIVWTVGVQLEPNLGLDCQV